MTMRTEIQQRPRSFQLEASGYGLAFRPHRVLRTDSSHRRHQFPANHPQVREREQRLELRGVLLEPTVAHLREAELQLDHPDRMLDLGANARLEPLGLLDQLMAAARGVQCTTLARSHRHMPLHARRLGAIHRPLIARVREHRRLFTVEQVMALRDVVDVGGCAHHGVD
jgi:hypothetical protein